MQMAGWRCRLRVGARTHHIYLNLECTALLRGVGQTRLIQILARLLIPCVTLGKYFYFSGPLPGSEF